METPIRTKADYQALWDETREFYSDESKLGMNSNGGCEYLQKESGNMCAVGRCLDTNTEKYLDIVKNGGSLDSIVMDFELEDFEEFNSIFLEQYRGYEQGFWEELQNWHDSHRFISKSTKETQLSKAVKAVESYIQTIEE